MKIHEYQAKAILDRYKVRIPRGEVTDDPSEARQIAERLGGAVVVKAQIHAGGRGKGGGVKLARSPAEAEKVANRICELSPMAVQGMKESMVRASALDYQAVDGITAEVQTRVMTSEDRKEGVKAFADRRPVDWPGK